MVNLSCKHINGIYGDLGLNFSNGMKQMTDAEFKAFEERVDKEKWERYQSIGEIIVLREGQEPIRREEHVKVFRHDDEEVLAKVKDQPVDEMSEEESLRLGGIKGKGKK